MQYISNICFWLQAAMADAASCLGVAALVFVISLLGIGLFAGRAWNAKWKLGLCGGLVSVILGLIAALLGAEYMAMGFIKATVLSPSARVAMQEDITRRVVDNSKLLEAAYQEGLNSIIKSGVESDALDPAAAQFVFPGATDDARRANKEQFIAGVVKTIARGNTPKAGQKAKKAALLTLQDIPPFSYGCHPVSKDADGSFFAALEEALQGREGQPVSMEDPFWFSALGKVVVEKSLKNLTETICKNIDSQRSSAMMLLIAILLVQLVLISWFAYSDIHPRCK